MPDTSPTLSLPFLLPSQAQKHVTHNEALSLLDVAVQTAVVDRDRTDPPGSPAPGECHIVAAPATGDWAGHEGEIAQFDGSGWAYFAAKPGWRAQVLAESRPVVFDGTGWQAHVSVPDVLDNLDGVGIGTTPDATNRLAVAAPATLFSHDGAGHQVKVNKALAADTASLLFQTGWSGRAEMGTAGSDEFEIKVSADGAVWNTGLSLDAVTGQAGLPQGAQIDGVVSGTAVQQSADDVTAGRLMRADYGYGPGNLLGPVSQAAGVPTGAVAERGSNANGAYVRFADGTQICTAVVNVGDITASGAGTWDSPYRSSPTLTWTYPAAFAAVPAVMGRSIPPSAASASPDRRQAYVSLGRANANACYQIAAVRFGSDTTADPFEVDLIAVGRWF